MRIVHYKNYLSHCELGLHMILLIDSYDSFSHNLRRLLEDNTDKHVTTIYNDTFPPSEYEAAFNSWIKYFDYIVVGPGPGHPDVDADIGIVKWLFQHFRESPSLAVPILGVCLGFQSLCNEFGNKVVRLDAIKHGQVYQIQPRASELFGSSDAELSEFPSVRYHSLHVELTTVNDQIVPLATCEDTEHSSALLMAARHVLLPLYGVQYHPESICSEKGDLLIRNFDTIAETYNLEYRANLAELQTSQNLKETYEKYTSDCAVLEDVLIPGGKLESNTLKHFTLKKFVIDDKLTLPLDVCDYLNGTKQPFIFLNSAADPGDWSVIGLPISGISDVITHSVDEPKVVRVSKFDSTLKAESLTVESVWTYVAKRMQQTYVSRKDIEARMKATPARPIPFFGGLMGLFSYEEGQHLQTDHLSSFCEGDTPDTKLVHIERSLLHDRVTNEWFICSTRDSEEEKQWCETFVSEISKVRKENTKSVPTSVKQLCKDDDQEITFEFPDREVYKKQFELCQEHLHSGDSYELCLTTQLKLFLPKSLDTWDIYKVLALHRNPSPYLCYMNFDDCVLISSSPERFVSWSDSVDMPDRKLVELRPIKGTVRKTDGMTLEKATGLLRTPKEMGENLMIVDLIRHDLNSFIDDVKVDSLMTVEEYKTVYQLVSVIQGHLPHVGHKGIDVLHSSLPPGSMTGAPKKRSVELLQEIEKLQATMLGGRRGIYSGVAGYWSVTDDADWSVVIRSIMHYKADVENTTESNVWRIGAGGAITVLSEEEAEWDEMQVKLSSTLLTFT